MSNCEGTDKRTLTVVLKGNAARAEEALKLAAVIDAKLGGPRLEKVPGSIPPAGQPEDGTLLGVAESTSQALSALVFILDRANRSL